MFEPCDPDPGVGDPHPPEWWNEGLSLAEDGYDARMPFSGRAIYELELDALVREISFGLTVWVVGQASRGINRAQTVDISEQVHYAAGQALAGAIPIEALGTLAISNAAAGELAAATAQTAIKPGSLDAIIEWCDKWQ